MQSIDALQREMRGAFLHGAPGMLVSAVIWLLAGTVWLIVGCVLSYGLYTANAAWFFPAMLLVIGSRYLAFQTLFGHRLYWVCGAALIAAGWLCAATGIGPAAAAFVGSAIEGLFAGILLLSARRTAA